MDKKILMGIVVVIVIVALAFIYSYKPKPPVSDTGEPVTVTSEEEYLLEEQLLVLMDEDLEQIAGELTEYNAEIESEMASDMGMFYYD